MQTIKMQYKDDVNYLELTVFDSNGRIFRNLHRKFLTQKLSLLTLKSNGKNEFTKALFISLFE